MIALLVILLVGPGLLLLVGAVCYLITRRPSRPELPDSTPLPTDL